MTQTTDELGRPRGHSLRDYWTTGTIASLCHSISDLGQVCIELRDERGLVLDAHSYEQDQGIVREIPQDATVHQIQIGDESIGSIVVYPESDENTNHTLMNHIGKLIALTAGEMCTDVSQLRYRVEEIDVLYKLSSLLVRGGRVKDMLRLTLELSLEVLGLDAGAIMLLPEDSLGIQHDEIENELQRSASIGLSDDWLTNPIPLSKSREFDRLSLEGEVVVSSSLMDDPRVLVPKECQLEGLVAFLGAGMVFDGKPIGVIRLYSKTKREFTNADRNLVRSLGESAAAAVEQARLLKLQARQRRLHRSLKIAGAVQKRMLPEVTPEFDRLELAGRYQPSQEIGGDFYDLFGVRNQLGVLVGDVVGKGVVAGLLMSAVRATIRAYAELSDDLSRVMIRTNDAVFRDTTVSEFVTIWYGMIDPESLMMRYVVAGHEQPLLFRKDKSGFKLKRLPGEGLVVGVIENEPYKMHTIQLRAGDILIAYTDGITDAMNFDMARFGNDRLESGVLEFLNSSPDASAQDILERIFWSMRQFVGLQDQADDETLVVVKVGD
ncbi:MAG: SpoIIE family protein phosphatase [Phycisphaerales bacterium]|nr:SpoIIE family protein phosphatase [Phycisphaerales bacterium]